MRKRRHRHRSPRARGFWLQATHVKGRSGGYANKNTIIHDPPRAAGDMVYCHGEEWAREPLRHTALQKEPSLQSCPAWSLLSLINLILPAVLAWALRPRIDHVAP